MRGGLVWGPGRAWFERGVCVYKRKGTFCLAFLMEFRSNQIFGFGCGFLFVVGFFLEGEGFFLFCSVCVLGFFYFFFFSNPTPLPPSRAK